MGTLVGCNNQNKNDNQIEGNEIYVTFDGYGLHGGTLEVNTNTELMETVSIDLVSTKKGEMISDVFTANEIVSIGAVNEYDTFEGWLVFKTEIYTDTDGFDTVFNTLESTKVYSTDELLAYAVPAYNITIAAKWASMDASQYYVEDDYMFGSETTGALVFNAKEGVLTLDASSKGLSESQTYTCWMEDGQSANDVFESDMWQKITGVVKEGATLKGWQVYEATSVTWSNEASTSDTSTSFVYDNDNVDFRYIVLEDCQKIEGLKSTDELLDFDIFSKVYYAEAIWE